MSTDRTHLRSYLPQSIVATTFMLALPLAVVWVSSRVLYFELHPAAALFASLALSLVCAVVASRIWEHRSRKSEISFSELMIWSWYRLQRAERRLERGLRAAEIAKTHEEQLDVLYELTAALESKDPYTRGHSRRVERHSFKIGVAMGLPLKDLEVLRMSASLHDVGKIRIPNYLLHKQGRLSDAERTVIEGHCVRGSEMVACIGDRRIVQTVRHHHERWDGDGYPDGMARTEIPLFARLVAVADSYDAIRSTRSYRVGASRDKAVGVLRSEAGHQFDPDVVDAFMRTLPARRSVVAALMSLATGPGAFWRHIERLSQRFGGTALAPTLGAVGTVVILGTSTLLTPANPVGPGTGATIVRSDRAIAPSGPWVSDIDLDGDVTHGRTKARRPADPDDARGKRREDRPARGEQRGRAGSGRSSPESATTEGRASNPQASSGEAGGVDLGRVDDPNVEGRDCKRGLGVPSKGSRLHCG